jgi:hypothetical protein
MTRKHTARTAFAVAGTGLLTAAGLAMAAPSASAEDTPTGRELLDQCDNGTDTCDFHPSGAPEEYTGAGHQVGETAFNCTPDLQRSTVNWSDTTGESNSFGVSLSAEVGFSEVFKVTIETSYQHTWESSHTEGQATNVDVRPGEKGWIERAPKMQKVHGTYEMHFGDPYYGHYIWYQDFDADGPLPGSTGDITQHTAAMTDQERTEHCG